MNKKQTFVLLTQDITKCIGKIGKSIIIRVYTKIKKRKNN